MHQYLNTTQSLINIILKRSNSVSNSVSSRPGLLRKGKSFSGVLYDDVSPGVLSRPMLTIAATIKPEFRGSPGYLFPAA
jgi:hypothetical protein